MIDSGRAFIGANEIHSVSLCWKIFFFWVRAAFPTWAHSFGVLLRLNINNKLNTKTSWTSAEHQNRAKWNTVNTEQWIVNGEVCQTDKAAIKAWDKAIGDFDEINFDFMRKAISFIFRFETSKITSRFVCMIYLLDEMTLKKRIKHEISIKPNYSNKKMLQSFRCHFYFLHRNISFVYNLRNKQTNKGNRILIQFLHQNDLTLPACFLYNR